MGFFDSVKKIAISAKCMAGWHGGKYSQIEGKPKCHLGKTCPDCKKYITTFYHQYSGWGDYKKPRSCEQERKCVHCGHIDTRIEHQSFKIKGKDDYCTEILECVRCGYKKRGEEDHNWSKTTCFENANFGHIEERCINCGKTRTRPKYRAQSLIIFIAPMGKKINR